MQLVISASVRVQTPNATCISFQHRVKLVCNGRDLMKVTVYAGHCYPVERGPTVLVLKGDYQYCKNNCQWSVSVNSSECKTINHCLVCVQLDGTFQNKTRTILSVIVYSQILQVIFNLSSGQRIIIGYTTLLIDSLLYNWCISSICSITTVHRYVWSTVKWDSFYTESTFGVLYLHVYVFM